MNRFQIGIRNKVREIAGKNWVWRDAHGFPGPHPMRGTVIGFTGLSAADAQLLWDRAGFNVQYLYNRSFHDAGISGDYELIYGDADAGERMDSLLREICKVLSTSDAVLVPDLRTDADITLIESMGGVCFVGEDVGCFADAVRAEIERNSAVDA